MLYMSRKKHRTYFLWRKSQKASGYVFIFLSRKGNSVNFVSLTLLLLYFWKNFLKSHSIIEIIWLMVENTLKKYHAVNTDEWFLMVLCERWNKKTERTKEKKKTIKRIVINHQKRQLWLQIVFLVDFLGFPQHFHSIAFVVP